MSSTFPPSSGVTSTGILVASNFADVRAQMITALRKLQVALSGGDGGVGAGRGRVRDGHVGGPLFDRGGLLSAAVVVAVVVGQSQVAAARLRGGRGGPWVARGRARRGRGGGGPRRAPAARCGALGAFRGALRYGQGGGRIPLGGGNALRRPLRLR